MEYEKIRELIKDMGDSKLKNLEIDFPDGTKISMEKDSEVVIKSVENTCICESKPKETIEERAEDGNNNLKVIKSPMVGTFYLKPSPTSSPYVEVGSSIEKGQTVCIIEAMKLMNEIESEFSGEIAEIFVKDGDPVEYGTELFSIK